MCIFQDGHSVAFNELVNELGNNKQITDWNISDLMYYSRRERMA